MALTPAAILALIASDLPDNSTGLITPAILRNVLNQMVGSFGLVSGGVQIVTAAGTTAILATTTLLIFNKAAPSASPCTLPDGALRDLLPFEYYDFSGNSGDMVFTAFGTQKINGQNGQTSPWTTGSMGNGKMTYDSAIPGWVAK